MIISTFFGSFSQLPSDLDTDDCFSADITLTTADISLLSDIFETETAWLASLQLENGAIPMTAVKNGTVSVNPYFADFAALALLDNSEKYAENVKMYMDWHLSHLNTSNTDYNGVDGTIYDYTITLEEGKIVKEEETVKDDEKSYDSTDSYAATFLMVLDKYYSNTGDKEYILNNRYNISRITDALFATYNMGLTYAKPDYQVKYLMDNCEVYEGLKSACEILSIITAEDTSYSMLLIKCERALEWLNQSIENKLWNAQENHYETALFKLGSVALEFSWDEYYPSATAQLFPIIHGIISPDSIRANHLYSTFCDYYDWESFDIPDAFYWGSNAYAAVLMNDTERVMKYMSNYSDLMDEHSYPLYNADASKVSMAAFEMLKKVK